MDATLPRGGPAGTGGGPRLAGGVHRTLGRRPRSETGPRWASLSGLSIRVDAPHHAVGDVDGDDVDHTAVRVADAEAGLPVDERGLERDAELGALHVEGGEGAGDPGAADHRPRDRARLAAAVPDEHGV